MASDSHAQKPTSGGEYGVEMHMGAFTFEEAVLKVQTEKLKAWTSMRLFKGFPQNTGSQIGG